MQITWYGHSVFRLDFAGKAVLIDPFFTFKLDAVIPCHYGSFPIIAPSADAFVAEMKGHATKVTVPHKGKAVAVK
jgi:L-ascorbate metabolism protein UlaG (beta-lactamase superfamily)